MTRPVGALAPAHATLARLRALLADALRSALDGADRAALVDFPTYANPGDSAIWLGELSVLREPGMPRLAACADARTYRPADLDARLGPRGAVVVTGGGNLGDLWPERQAFHERVVADFPRRRVVLAPQSVHFEDPRALAKARAAFDAHPDLALLVRDAKSLDVARAAFRARVALAPDAAFGLRLPPAPPPGRGEVLCLLRRDRESALPGGASPPGVRVADWNVEPPGRVHKVHRHLRRAAEAGSRWRRALLPLTYAPLARRRVRAAVRLLAGADAVVTDCLHGHVLATLLGRPQVLLPERSGKLRALHETWTRDLPFVRSADDLGAAVALARGLSAGAS
jgi:pyruvyl transferase EpsO